MSETEKKTAILVGIAKSQRDMAECEISIDELERLADTAGAKAYAKVIQIKESYDPRTLIGKGKVLEVKELCKESEAELVIFDVELSPMQIRNLEADIGEDVTVIDRSMLILDIFALHATSGEGKLQVELAQLKYTAPRLVGRGLELSRQGGGIGSRGPGETKLETDRRHLHAKIASLEARLEELDATRMTMREKRDRSGITKIAIVGYTNAGKSTLLNALTGADVLSEDKLFATLDATTRRTALPSGIEVLFTDTVGFIRKLPHHFVKAFKSTLDEVKYADILLIVSDIADSEVREHIKVTERIIEDLSASDKPRLYVYNKADTLPDLSYADVDTSENSVIISAKRMQGVDKLLALIENVIKSSKKQTKLIIPYTEQSKLNSLFNEYEVISSEYLDTGVLVLCELDAKGLGYYKNYIVD